MIQLKLVPKPTQLTNEIIEALTTDFQKDNHKSVWKKSYIVEALLEMSHSKCCYSECRLDEKSNYMEVEHFYAKSLYPDKVIEWENLFPSSKKCNTTKGNLDVVAIPIIHPVLDNPKEHIYLKDFRFYGITPKGENTIKYTGLNDRKHWVTPRAKLVDIIKDRLSDIQEQLDDLEKEKTKGRVKRQIKNLMIEGTKIAEFSAVTATTILHDVNYLLIKSTFQNENLWNDELINLENEMLFCALKTSS